MRICVLGSGSKGNSTYIETENSKILIDAGLSKCEMEKRLSLLDINPYEIDAILVTHEHGDHIKGVGQFARKYKNKVYANSDTWKVMESKLGDLSCAQQVEFNGNDFYIKDMAIQSFDVDHDAQHCVGFSIIENNKKFTITTDLGHITPEITNRLSTSEFIVLESNYDLETLKHNPHYPYHLKNRILSKFGHLCNDETAKTITQLLGKNTRGVILAHLSEENNSPETAIRTVRNALVKNQVTPSEDLYIDVAHQDRVGHIYKIKD